MADADTRGISLTRYEQERAFIKNRGDAFRLKIVAHSARMMPSAIFLHQRRLIDPHEGATCDEFVTVASPFDGTIYPINEPDPHQMPQFFRKDTIDILVPSQDAAMTVSATIQRYVCQLVESYNQMDTLLEMETIRCGAPLDAPEPLPEPEPAPSISESQSESL